MGIQRQNKNKNKTLTEISFLIQWTNSHWVIDQNVKYKTVKGLEHIGEKLHNLHLGEEFLSMTVKE